jgi:hypothetical protein
MIRRVPSMVLSVGVAVLSSSLWSCGGDDEGSSGSSSVPGPTLLTAVSADQARELCMFAERTYKDTLPDEETYCKAWAASDASSASACEVEEQNCLDSNAYQDDVDEDWECDDADADHEGVCTATVSEYEACLRARARARTAFYEIAGCDKPASFGDRAEPTECVTLRSKCADISF